MAPASHLLVATDMHSAQRIPVIDLFAGPGGLGEGFSAFRHQRQRRFKIGLSIEKDPFAHRTLELRAFFRQFPDHKAPQDYYDYLSGAISRDELFRHHPKEAAAAASEAWLAEMGAEQYPAREIDRRIRGALGLERKWVLIGGPPCQAYSLAGRSRRTNDPSFAADEKHFLYRQYLRIIAAHQPPVFVMENVKGLLSARVREEAMLDRITSDLENPLKSFPGPTRTGSSLSYRLFSLVVRNGDLLGRCSPNDFVVKAESYGVPQARHRLILLGIRQGHPCEPGLLQQKDTVSIHDVISDLPLLRSGLSRESDNPAAWHGALMEIKHAAWLQNSGFDRELRREILNLLEGVSYSLTQGANFLPRTRRKIHAHKEWFSDERLAGVCNHETRLHIRADLHRYFFVAAYGRLHGRSPLLNDMPPELLPKHQNVAGALKESKFNDRFRVQLEYKPSTTVTSHISKDGHYFIHYDPRQCRSLTVREAARLQTFPDNYFFEGPRTQQYHQVGNAVPPLLAHQIAKIVHDIF